MSLVSQARSLGKYFLLLDNLLVVLGFFVVFPLISIRFVDQLGWAALIVGIALGLRQLLQQGLGIFGGAIADRFGAKPMIVTGMLLRAAGFATMAMADEPWILWFSCALSALGGTLFDPPRTALVIKLTRPHERGRFFSLLMMQDSAGAVVGALIGSWLLQYDFHFVCWVGGGDLRAGCRLECLVTAGLSHLHRTRADERRPVAGSARSPLPHLCPDADRLLHAGGAGDADDAYRGQRNCRFTGGGEMDVRDRSGAVAVAALSVGALG